MTRYQSRALQPRAPRQKIQKIMLLKKSLKFLFFVSKIEFSSEVSYVSSVKHSYQLYDITYISVRPRPPGFNFLTFKDSQSKFLKNQMLFFPDFRLCIRKMKPKALFGSQHGICSNKEGLSRN